MPEYEGIGYLREKLSQKRTRVNLRYDFYEMKNHTRDLGISTPPALTSFQSVLGWCGTAVDSLADRLEFREFANDDFNMNEIFNMNNPDVFFGSAILSALIGSCSFVYISKDENGYPRLQVIDGANATGIIDPITGMLKEGYAVLDRDKYGNATLEAYFITGETHYYRKGERSVEVFRNLAPYPLLVPIIFKPDARRPFGHSRISRANMDIMASALRTIKRSEISAEFYSFPQKYILGMHPDAEQYETWRLTLASMLRIDKDEDGDHPVVGQFSQQSMAPHSDQLRMFASLFAGQNGLTLDDLGFATENPSSAEAIKAAHENLVKTARKAQKTFGSGFLNVGYLSTCLRDDYSFSRSRVYRTRPLWEPIFEPDAASLSSIGDGAIKINQAVPGYFNKDNLRTMTGIDASEIEEPVVLTNE